MSVVLALRSLCPRGARPALRAPGIIPPPRRPGLTPRTHSALLRSATRKSSGEATKKAPLPKKAKACSAAVATKVVTVAAMLAARATPPTADAVAVRNTAASGKNPPTAKSTPMTLAHAALFNAVIDGMQSM